MEPEIECHPTSNPTHAQFENIEGRAYLFMSAIVSDNLFSLGCTRNTRNHLIHPPVSHLNPCVQFLHCIMVSLYSVSVGANTDRPPALRRVRRLRVHYATLFVQESMYSEHYTTSSSNHMLGCTFLTCWEQIKLIFCTALARFICDTLNQICICVEMLSDFLVWKC